MKKESALKHFVSNNKLAALGGTIIIIFIIIAIFAPVMTKYEPNRIDLSHALEPPSAEHWFGTDNNGRDTFTRTMYGTRVSLLIGFTSVLSGAIIGVTLGLIAG